MRFVFFDNDTRILFATAYDGDWDTYINDFATKIPIDGSAVRLGRGWPGIASPKVKDFIAEHQITAAGWFVANPQVTVVDVRRSSAWSMPSTNSWTRWAERWRSFRN
jgi:hypothetical protein